MASEFFLSHSRSSNISLKVSYFGSVCPSVLPVDAPFFWEWLEDWRRRIFTKWKSNVFGWEAGSSGRVGCPADWLLPVSDAYAYYFYYCWACRRFVVPGICWTEGIERCWAVPGACGGRACVSLIAFGLKVWGCWPWW